MPSDRVEVLKAMLSQDPANTFAKYGLAMEYLNSGNPALAADEFRALMNSAPDYAASYFHAGRAFEQLGDTEEARRVMERGIEVTTRIGDLHARSELQAALDLLGS